MTTMRRQNHHHQQPQQQRSRVFDELVLLLTNLLRSPPSPVELFSCASPLVAFQPSSTRRRAFAAPVPITPSGFASLMLGVSVALMLCGSVTFFIGFMLMPWVIGLFLILYVVGFVSGLSVLGRTIFCYASSAAFAAPSPMRHSPRKYMPPW